jgi:hypothetical protein
VRLDRRPLQAPRRGVPPGTRCRCLGSPRVSKAPATDATYADDTPAKRSTAPRGSRRGESGFGWGRGTPTVVIPFYEPPDGPGVDVSPKGSQRVPRNHHARVLAAPRISCKAISGRSLAEAGRRSPARQGGAMEAGGPLGAAPCIGSFLPEGSEAPTYGIPRSRRRRGRLTLAALLGCSFTLGLIAFCLFGSFEWTYPPLRFAPWVHYAKAWISPARVTF